MARRGAERAEEAAKSAAEVGHEFEAHVAAHLAELRGQIDEKTLEDLKRKISESAKASFARASGDRVTDAEGEAVAVSAYP